VAIGFGVGGSNDCTGPAAEAKRDQIGYRVAKLPMANVLRTETIAEPRGFMKMLIGKDSDEILGFTAFGVEASELMAAVQTAMVGRMPFTMLRDAIFTHPTMSEGLVFLLGQVESRQGELEAAKPYGAAAGKALH